MSHTPATVTDEKATLTEEQYELAQLLAIRIWEDRVGPMEAARRIAQALADAAAAGAEREREAREAEMRGQHELAAAIRAGRAKG